MAASSNRFDLAVGKYMHCCYCVAYIGDMRVGKDFARNLLFCCGAYYISSWAGYPTTIASSPIVTAGLHALVAFTTGVTVAWLVDSKRVLSWAMFLSALYVFFGTFGYQWAHVPSYRERLAQLLGPMIMGISCLVGAACAVRWIRYLRTVNS